MEPKKVETWQIQRIHAALASRQLANDKEYKADQVRQYTNGRGSSTKHLSFDEANKWIADLNRKPEAINKPVKDEARERRLKGVFSMMHKLKWYTKETKHAEKPKLDYKALDEWLVKYGHHHKSLDGHKTEELSVVIFQLGEVAKGNLKEV